jgi:large subunit ribosomal protein L11
MKQDDLLGATVKARVLEVAGNCVSVGVAIYGKKPKVFQKDVKAGMYDKVLC